jgi:site-specific DNA recombinase
MMPIVIVEEDDMPARQTPAWRLRRHLSPRPDGQQRWDRAYLHLLRWTQPPLTSSAPTPHLSDRRAVMTVALYVRVSTPRQTYTQTIEQQLERLRARVQECDPEQRAEYVVFRDDGYSGTTLRRPGPDALRDAVASAEIERVLMTAPDRRARKYVHQVLLLEELERFGCVVEFLERPTSQDPHDQLLLQIRGAVAEYERTLIAERMRRGRLAKLRSGTLLPWTRVPYGYRVDPNRPRDPSGV